VVGRLLAGLEVSDDVPLLLFIEPLSRMSSRCCSVSWFRSDSAVMLVALLLLVRLLLLMSGHQCLAEVLLQNRCCHRGC